MKAIKNKILSLTPANRNPYQISQMIGGSFDRGRSLYHTWDFSKSEDEVIEGFINKNLSDTSDGEKTFGNVNYGFPCSITGWMLHQKYNKDDYTARTTALFRRSKKGWILIALVDRGANKSLAEIISSGMASINGLPPQHVSEGVWINPKSDATACGFISVNSIKIFSFSKNNN